MQFYLKCMILTGLLLSISGACNRQKQSQQTQAPERELAEQDYQDLYQYFTPDPNTQFEREQNAIIDLAMNKQWNLQRSSSGLFYEISVPGPGDSIRWGEKVRVHYEGSLLSGKIFDSSHEKGKPIEFRVGEMIPAWNEALRYMTRGSTVVIVSPSHLAYGEEGFEGFVGPNEVLVFEMEILP